MRTAQPGAPGQVLGPRDRLGPQLEGVEVDVAQPQHGRPQLVAAGARAPARPCRARPASDDAVHGRRGELEAGGELGQAHPPGALQRGQHADRAVDRLDHASPPLVTSDDRRAISELLRNSEPACVTSATHSTLSNDVREPRTCHRKGTGHARRDHSDPAARRRGHRDRVPGVHRRRLGARHPDRQRQRAVHDGRPRHDLARVRHDRGRDGLRPRAHRRQPHQPGRDARAGRLRQVPLVAGARPTSAPRSSARSSARPPSSACSARRPATSGSASRRTATSAGCRRSPPSSSARSSWCSRSSA